MDHEQAFFQAIREQPDDDAHRLIYADWLEEQGGADRAARAAFIRAQCRLDALLDDDPLRDDLEDEAVDLLAEHEDEWTQPLHGIAQDWRFARGFIEHITIRGENFLTHAERLFAFTPLRAIHLLIGPKDMPRLSACPCLSWVESLDFRRCFLTDRSLRQLLTSPHLGRLTALDLTSNGINTPGAQALVHSPVMGRLRRLDLSCNLGIGDKAVRLLAQAPPANNLETLGLAETNLSVEGLYDLLQSTSLSRLGDLDVSGGRFTLAQQTYSAKKFGEPRLLGQLRNLDLSGAGVALSGGLLQSSNLSHLQILHLRGMGAGRADLEMLASCPGLANLTLFDLRDNKLGADGARTLADYPFLGSLKHLNLGVNNIRDTGAKAIVESPHLTQLTGLDLAHNGIGGPGLKALATSANLVRLTTLNLAGNFIGPDSVQALMASAYLSRLSRLDLSDAQLEADSARILASAPSLAHLTMLRLQDNSLGDAGAKALAESPHLKRLSTLDLFQNHIGKSGAEALAAAPCWRRLRQLELGANVFTDTEEALLRKRFGKAVLL